MKKLKIIVLLISLTALVSCSQIRQMGEGISNSAEQKGGVKVPRNMRNSFPEWEVNKDYAAIVTLPNNTDILFGAENKPLKSEELGKQFEQYFAAMGNKSDPRKCVYIVADSANDYASLVKIFEIARKQKLMAIKLAVSPNDKADEKSTLDVELADAPDSGNSKPVKPNPLLLVVTMERDGKLKLNQNNETLGTLTARLKEVFRDREANGVFKEGTNEVYKPVTLKGFRSAKYEEVARLIDALKEAGASLITLQIDDLSD